MHENDPIHIAFCISDSFARHAAVVIASAVESAPGGSLVFHILSGDLSDTNQQLLSAMSSATCSVVFHHVDRTLFDHYPTSLEYFSQEIYYRFLIPELIKEKRVIYSDVDVLIYQSLRQLHEMDLQGNALAAVREYNEYWGAETSNACGWRNYKQKIGMNPKNVYFYSGLLVMDCDALRSDNFTQRCFEDTEVCIKTLDADTFGASDQVVINRLYDGKITELSPAWCVTDVMKRVYKGETAIRHFAGQYEKPWCNVAWNTSWFAYLKYLLKTPYRREAIGFILGHLWGIIYSSHVKKGVRRSFLFGLRLSKRKV